MLKYLLAVYNYLMYSLTTSFSELLVSIFKMWKVTEKNAEILTSSVPI